MPPKKYLKQKNKIFRKNSKLNRLLAMGVYSKIAFIVIFGVVGTYFLGLINAQPANDNIPSNRPERGVNYGSAQFALSGPCKGQIEHKHEKGNTSHDPSPIIKPDVVSCSHIDPGPRAVDVRERVKNIETELAEQVRFDEKNPPAKSDSPPGQDTEITTPNDLGYGGSLGEVAARNWPCYGTGTDGYRVQWVFAYNLFYNSSRVETWRSSIESIAKRVNNTFYLSSMDAGFPKQVRYVTDSSCKLSIATAQITGNLDDFRNIADQLRNKGYNRTDRKYIVSLEGGSNCGAGESPADDSSSLSNRANSGNLIAIIWKPCWNYAEPHELMHTLGAVQDSAPHSTGRGHCWDQSDIMCYDDGGDFSSGKRGNSVCSTSNFWRFDCNKDDYFDSWKATGYLSTHWNTATSYFLKGGD